MLFLALRSNAQTAACSGKEIPASIAVEVRETNLADPVTGLSAEHFLLDGKGVRPDVLKLTTGLPADLVILIEDRPRGGVLAGAADLLLKSLVPGDLVGVMTYGVSTKRNLALSQDAAKIQLAIEQGADGGHLQIARPLYGVADALKLFPKYTPGRLRAIFMLGDNQDNSSQIRTEQLAANLIEERVSLELAVDPAPPRKIPRVNVAPPMLGRDTPGQAPPQVGPQSLGDLARWTGGSTDFLTEAAFLQRMRERLKARVVLDYCVERKHAGKVPLVRLSTEALRKWPSAQVLAPGVTKDR
jgi:hypothetical protein